MAKVSKKTTENDNELKKETNAFVNLENKKQSSTNSSKRKIKNITLKKEPIKTSKNIEPSIENSDITQQITNTISNTSKEDVLLSEKTPEIKNMEKSKKQKNRKSKRTLHLNIQTDEKEAIENVPSIPYVVDTSINQNSPFFSEPSVFEKLNITISSFDDEENDNNEKVEESISEDISDSITLDNLLESDIEINLEDLDNNSQKDAIQNNIEHIENSETSNTTSNLEIKKEIAKNIKNEFVENTENISTISSHPSSVLKNTVKKVSGTFFNTSSIFKSFTFEDVNFINKNTESTENIENAITNSQTPEVINLISEHDSSKIIDNTSVPTIETSAEPIVTKIADLNTTTIDIKNNIDLSKDLNNEANINYNTIITPLENNNNISIDEDLIDELITNSDFIDDEFDEKDFESYDEFSNINNNLESELLSNDIINDSEIEDYDNDKNYDDSSDELLENEITDEDLEEFKNKPAYDDDNFSIESYFGIDNLSDDEDENSDSEFSEEDDTLEEEIDADIPETHLSPTEFENEFFKANDSSENNEANLANNAETQQPPEMVATFSKLIENFTETISTLSNRIADLETKKSEETLQEQPVLKQVDEENVEIISNNNSEQDIENTSNTTIEANVETSIIDDISLEDISDDELINELDIEPDDTENSLISEETLELESDISDDTQENNTDNNNLENEKSIEDILTDTLLNENLDQDLSDELLSEIISEQDIENSTIDTASPSNEINDSDLEESLLEDILLENIYQEDLKKAENQEKTTTISELTTSEKEPASDFLTIIDSLSKTISDLENSPDIKSNLIDNDNSGKSINILINKDDIFSISILNETYEIVTDFDGISVLSENIHISTPKNNFFVKIGKKYIEIHKKPEEFLVKTNFEDIEFVNSINNVAFGKKDNIIELNIKEAFKLSSVNNKVELSMLNTSIANISNTNNANVDENSICDNRTLLISEETQKVYLPYTIEEIMKKLNNSDEYQTAKEVIENEYTLPLSTFKTPILSRFKEAYKLMRIKEKSSIYAAIDLGLELMFNSNLNPAIIRACKDLKELNIYLDCLYENELDKFDCFKIVYKVLPKIQ